MTPLLDDTRRREQQIAQSAAFRRAGGGLGLVTAFSAWLIWSWTACW